MRKDLKTKTNAQIIAELKSYRDVEVDTVIEILWRLNELQDRDADSKVIRRE